MLAESEERVLAKLGATLRKLPPGRFLGYGMEAGMDGTKKLAIFWAWGAREGPRKGAFAIETGEYLTELF